MHRKHLGELLDKLERGDGDTQETRREIDDEVSYISFGLANNIQVGLKRGIYGAVKEGLPWRTFLKALDDEQEQGLAVRSAQEIMAQLDR